jgi:hypothetical protein
MASQIIVAKPSAGNHRGEPSVRNWSADRVKRAQSEEACSASRNRCLVDNDAHWRITQNHRQQEYDRDPANLRNVINDRRCLMAWTSSPPRCSPVQAPTPLGSDTFHALAPELKQVVWLDKFKPGPIDKYNCFGNRKEFIQVYNTVIETAGRHIQVKANYLPTTFSITAKSCLVNLPEGTIYN